MPDKEIIELLGKLDPMIRKIGNFNLLRDGFYKGVLKYSFVRAYEFALYANSLPDEDKTAFFCSGALRGICEDLIVLKFLHKLRRKDRDSAISARMLQEAAKATTRQRDFFKSYRPFQPTFSFKRPNVILKKATDDLKTLGLISGLWTGKMPTIETMARRTRLLSLYRFIYSMTSDLVHFNPRIAFRAGWGDIPRKIEFSSKNFSRYYLDFCRLYSTLMLVMFFEKFSRITKTTKEDQVSIKALRNSLNRELRWPEAVTYEEMNVEGPNQFIRIVLHVAHDDEQSKRLQAKKSRPLPTQP
ncbi:MAG TPA: DUF5677 domain-containing protein [Candidatus Angelobacter sp.]|nr:DUF5677 domain-containing protein [Candidatus Angelobacter sp.]